MNRNSVERKRPPPMQSLRQKCRGQTTSTKDPQKITKASYRPPFKTNKSMIEECEEESDGNSIFSRQLIKSGELTGEQLEMKGRLSTESERDSILLVSGDMQQSLGLDQNNVNSTNQPANQTQGQTNPAIDSDESTLLNIFNNQSELIRKSIKPVSSKNQYISMPRIDQFADNKNPQQLDESGRLPATGQSNPKQMKKKGQVNFEKAPKESKDAVDGMQINLLSSEQSYSYRTPNKNKKPQIGFYEPASRRNRRNYQNLQAESPTLSPKKIKVNVNAKLIESLNKKPSDQGLQILKNRIKNQKNLKLRDYLRLASLSSESKFQRFKVNSLRKNSNISASLMESTNLEESKKKTRNLLKEKTIDANKSITLIKNALKKKLHHTMSQAHRLLDVIANEENLLDDSYEDLVFLCNINRTFDQNIFQSSRALNDLFKEYKERRNLSAEDVENIIKTLVKMEMKKAQETDFLKGIINACNQRKNEASQQDN